MSKNLASRNFVGQRFGKWTVLSFDATPGRRKWVCQCDCGTTRPVLESSLMFNKSLCCGCDTVERWRRQGLSNKRHGKSHESIYVIWWQIKSRCCNPQDKGYMNYGGRGIKVCERWKKFDAFLEDMGDRPGPEYSIDRIDNNGDYCKENCRWATDTEQARNRRSNHLLTFNGKTQSIVEWAEELGIKYVTLRTRIRDGWSVEDALTRPVNDYFPSRLARKAMTEHPELAGFFETRKLREQ